MPAASLQDAANQAYDDMFIHWNTTQLKVRLTGFGAALASTFNDKVPNDRPVGDWLIPIQALASAMGIPRQPLTQFNAAVQYVYRICWAADAMSTASPALITPAQAAAVLTQFNTWLS